MRPIKITKEKAETICKNIYDKIVGSYYSSDNITINMFEQDKKIKTPINLKFTNIAWSKMTALITSYNSEIGWHGIVNRTSPTSFVVSDIVVYPQTVTNITVVSDNEDMDCSDWYSSLDDEVIENMKMQCHSHVNMKPNPSSVDENDWKQYLYNLGDDDYYIFMIWNKNFEFYVRIYDMKTNTMYSTGDVIVSYDCGFVEDFLEETRKLIHKKIYTPNKAYTHNKE